MPKQQNWKKKNKKRSSTDANIGSLAAEIRNDIRIKNLENENREIERRQKLYAELNTELFKTGTLKKENTGIIPGVEEKRLANLKKEKGELEQLKLKQLEIEEIRKQGKWSADVFTFADQGKLNMIDAEIQKVEQLLDLFHAKPAGTPEAPAPASDNKATNEQLKKDLQEIETAAAQRRIKAMQEYEDRKSYEEKLLEIEKDAIRKKQALYKEGTEEYVKYEEELQKFDLKATQDRETAELKRQEAIRALIEKYNKEAAETDEQKKQLELDNLNEHFSEELRMTEQYLQLKQAIEDKYDPERKKLKKSFDTVVADNKKFDKKTEKEKPESFAELEMEKEALKSAKDAELAIIDAAEAAGLNSEINYQEERQLVLDRYNKLELEKDKEKQKAKPAIAQFGLEQVSTLLSAASSYVQAGQQAEEAAVEAKYDKQIKAAGKNTKQVEKLEKKKEEELAKIRAEYEDKSFAIQVAQALASTAMAAINAYTSTALIPIVGPGLAPIAAGVATAAGILQVEAIRKQHEAAKANYWTGGFTPAGEWDEPQGVVHSNEFVANRFATAQPLLRPLFNMVDYAQRNNTVASLKKEDIAKAVGIKGFSGGGYTTAPAALPAGSTKQDRQPELSLLISAIDRLNKKPDEPFVGEVSIAGRKGVKENLDRYEKLIKNASR